MGLQSVHTAPLPAGEGPGGRAFGLLCLHVVVGEVLAVGWQLMVLQRGEDFLELHEEPFAGSVAVGIHVEGCAQTFGEIAQQVLVGFGEERG